VSFASFRAAFVTEKPSQRSVPIGNMVAMVGASSSIERHMQRNLKDPFRLQFGDNISKKRNGIRLSINKSFQRKAVR
jgi:hypothetical protein